MFPELIMQFSHVGCNLSDKSLIEKVSINSVWTAEEVARQLTSIFATAFNLQPGELLPFDYLG